MIQTLHIKNVGIISEISIELNDGLNVFTGETGARKIINNRVVKNTLWWKILKRDDKNK